MRCGDCRLFRESTQRYFETALCLRKGYVDEDDPSCKAFVPMPKRRVGTRIIWGKEKTRRCPG